MYRAYLFIHRYFYQYIILAISKVYSIKALSSITHIKMHIYNAKTLHINHFAAR